uniref:Uncharacterized protein n=1 Tax=Nannospalax galili TaxID=1026970 RepID=A0A8C6RIZ6_NANGA
MELAQEARELGCWAAEEMGVPEAARAPESTLRRLCLGQGADIWAYIMQHVRSQRYGHQDSPEVRNLCFKILFHPKNNKQIFCCRPCRCWVCWGLSQEEGESQLDS